MLNGKIKYGAKVIRGRSYFKYIKPLTQCCPIPYRIQINYVEVFYRPVVKLGGIWECMITKQTIQQTRKGRQLLQ